MAPPSHLPRRAGFIIAALVAPWLVYACDLVPLGPGTSGTGGSGTSTASSSGTSGTGGSGTSTASSSGTMASSSTGTGGAPHDAGDAGSDGGDASETGGDAGDGGDAASCDTAVVLFPILASPHVMECLPVSYASNPPTSGPHYMHWASYKTYTVPVERGFYVHDLQHGAIVILYNCPSGCDADLAQLAAWLDARPADPACQPPVKARIVVTPDPLIPTRFAAAAWGWALTSQCFDLAALGPFIDAHYAMGPEPVCADGWDVTAADAGIPDGCGEATDGGDGG